MAVKCPHCKKELSENAYRPFCSERCQLIDLGHWISETYRIPQQGADEDENGPDPSSKPSEKE